MMALSTATPVDPVRSFSLPLLPKHRHPPTFLTFLRPTYTKLMSRFSSLQATPCSRRHLLAYACLSSHGESDLPAESEPSPPEYALKEATFDLKLPRRNLIVKFTCNSCGERTQRIINRLAYERGTVFVQCAGCLLNHKLVDNLGLVVEYDLRNGTEAESDPTTQD